mgnify:CR=1 FL=1
MFIGAAMNERAVARRGRIDQMRSTRCHGPSWQNISSCGSVGENCRWFSQSVELVNDLLLAGRGVHGEHRHRNARLLALQQPHFLGLGEGQRLAVLAGGRVVGVEARIARALFELPGAFGIHAEQQRLVGIHRADEAALDLARCVAALRRLLAP